MVHQERIYDGIDVDLKDQKKYLIHCFDAVVVSERECEHERGWTTGTGVLFQGHLWSIIGTVISAFDK